MLLRTSGKARLQCPKCGTVEVPASHVTVLDRLVYTFECPTCSSWIIKEANAQAVTLLVRTGARIDRQQPLDDHSGPPLSPISTADLIVFHDKIEQLPTAHPETPN